MRTLFVMAVLCFFASAAFAQSPAADKDAIDLSNALDTIAIENGNESPVGNLNIGIKNQDPWEDFELIWASTSEFATLRYGGPFFSQEHSSLKVGGYPDVCADLDGDSITDLITSGILFYKGKKDSPYFDPSSNGRLQFHDFPSRKTIGAADYNQDGYNDVLVAADDGVDYRFYLFAGDTAFGKDGKVFPSDSILITPRPKFTHGLCIAKMGKSLPLMVMYGQEIVLDSHTVFRIGIIPNTKPLWQNDIIWLSNSDSGGIAVQNLYATDITGDGISDLLVSDGMIVYVFKGGDNFGTYPLTPQNAFYKIKSPRLLDFGNYGFLKNFGSSIRACGDMTGSGIPFIAIDANVDEPGYYKGYTFFYAGGKALDSLYDAVISQEFADPTVTDTLHNIEENGHTVPLLFDNAQFNSRNLILYSLTDQIPHKTNPQMSTIINESGRSPVSLKARSGGGYVDILIDGESPGEHQLSIYDILGKKLAERNLGYIGGRQIEQFDTKDLASGTYIAVLQGRDGTVSVKFPVSRQINEQAPESPLIWEMHETIPAVGGLR